jgi:predicted branched-subunit amino acid permease
MVTTSGDNPNAPPGFANRRAAFRGGMRESAAMPALVLGASFLGFGSLCHDAGWPLVLGLVSTTTTWALPGQIVLIELYGVGASAAAILFAVWLTGMRLFPMTLTLMPCLRHPGTPRSRYYLAAHLISITSWAIGMQRCPTLPSDQRLPYFFGFAITLWSFATGATIVGFYLIALLPAVFGLALLFINPLYFLLLFANELGRRERVLALGIGAVAGPLFHLVTPDWGLLYAGLVGGTAAFLLDRQLGA